MKHGSKDHFFVTERMEKQLRLIENIRSNLILSHIEKAGFINTVKFRNRRWNDGEDTTNDENIHLV